MRSEQEKGNGLPTAKESLSAKGADYSTVETFIKNLELKSPNSIETFGEFSDLVIKTRLTTDPETPMYWEFNGSPGATKTSSTAKVKKYIERLNAKLSENDQINTFTVNRDDHEKLVVDLLKDLKNTADFNSQESLIKITHLELLYLIVNQKKVKLDDDLLQELIASTDNPDLPSAAEVLKMVNASMMLEISNILSQNISNMVILVDMVALSDSQTKNGMKVSGRAYETGSIFQSIKEKKFPFEFIPDTLTFTSTFIRGVNCYLYDFVRNIQQEETDLDASQVTAFYLGFNRPNSIQDLRKGSQGASWEHIVYALYSQRKVIQALEYFNSAAMTIEEREQFIEFKKNFPPYFQIPTLLIPESGRKDDLPKIDEDTIYLYNLIAPRIFENPTIFYRQLANSDFEQLPPQLLPALTNNPSINEIRKAVTNYNINLLMSRTFDNVISTEIGRATRISKMWRYDAAQFVDRFTLLVGLADQLVARKFVNTNYTDASVFVISSPQLGVIDSDLTKVIIQEYGCTLKQLQRGYYQMIKKMNQRGEKPKRSI